ncbi:negative elongation factor A [Neodiprion pinetum]|uniref:Negative elongation factor A n=1 Tax=Neodiprion lecontei TaxID=441921 RepID=A0A6J0C2Y1_NEOLC|nr:negative elongation factor A [Neodiprion lecontei]XP_046490370.1 negative elongation factor A [Neodiprion pinetum]XP_046490371.1 negative elongation factor A [Neodiprion pinetum]XP_046601024.1 negative elongation factor A [Neodiprion lecontei]
MANVRDSDTSLWLHNKLGTSNDSWTGSSICSQLNAEVLRNIKDCFPDLQTQVKLKLLLSFFHLQRRNVEEWRIELEEIIEVASLDNELWVSMLSEAMKTFPSTGSLNTDISDLDEHRPIFGELVNDLRKLVKKQCDAAMLPLECHYLNKTALTSVVGQQPASIKHFTLKRKPKSAALRAELLQKSADAASNMKKSAAPTVPVRSRGMPRKMTDTTPLKGIPSRVPTSGFRSPSLTSPSMSNRTPIGSRIRKDGGIKLLDINEQPLGYAQAKKRKRMLELEEQQKKAAEAQAAAAATAATVVPTSPETPATPEYAQGLAPLNPPATPVAPTQPYATPISTPTTGVATIAAQTLPTPIAPATASSTLPVVNPTTSTILESSPVNIQIVRPTQTITQIRIQTTAPPATAAANTRKGLSLTREQMLEAQDMFRTANKVTRPEKAVILGFMAGSRDNPCPKLGNIVTVMLSENIEEVTQADGSTVSMLVETHFQMNYTNGEWKRIKKNRRIVTEEPAAAGALGPNATATVPN